MATSDSERAINCPLAYTFLCTITLFISINILSAIELWLSMPFYNTFYWIVCGLYVYYMHSISRCDPIRLLTTPLLFLSLLAIGVTGLMGYQDIHYEGNALYLPFVAALGLLQLAIHYGAYRLHGESRETVGPGHSAHLSGDSPHDYKATGV